MIGDLSGLWRFRYLIRLLIGRNIKIKYQHSFLGLVWTFPNPLLIPAVLLAVFTNVVRIDIYDVRHLLPIILTALFYISPVICTVGTVPEEYRLLYLLNPLAGLLGLFHMTLYEGIMPSLTYRRAGCRA
jgi:ABC-type polysaccharide/polyol phosphate export permease